LVAIIILLGLVLILPERKVKKWNTLFYY
jgi:hypothetical protein